MITRLKKTLAAFLLVAVFSPALLVGIQPPQEAHAQSIINSAIGAGAGGLACYFQGSLLGQITSATALFNSAISVPVHDRAVWSTTNRGASSAEGDLFKECVLDPLAWFIKSVLIAQITGDVIDWQADGGPFGFGGASFVQDPVKFAKHILTETTSAFLFEQGLDQLLCSPFQLDVIFNVWFDFSRPQSANSRYATLSCDLDDIFPGVGVDVGYNTFVNQGNFDFEDGGFDTFFGMLNDNNNPYGSFYKVQAEAASRAQRAQNKENTLLVYGNGFFSPRCDVDGDGTEEICTPGTFVTEQLIEYTSAPLEQLEIADEAAEVLDALFQVLITNILNSSLWETSAGSAPVYNSGFSNTTWQGNYTTPTFGEEAPPTVDPGDITIPPIIIPGDGGTTGGPPPIDGLPALPSLDGLPALPGAPPIPPTSLVTILANDSATLIGDINAEEITQYLSRAELDAYHDQATDIQGNVNTIDPTSATAASELATLQTELDIVRAEFDRAVLVSDMSLIFDDFTFGRGVAEQILNEARLLDLTDAFDRQELADLLDRAEPLR